MSDGSFEGPNDVNMEGSVIVNGDPLEVVEGKTCGTRPGYILGTILGDAYGFSREIP